MATVKKRRLAALSAVLMMLAMILPASALADTATVNVTGGSYATDGSFTAASWVSDYTYTYTAGTNDTAWDAFRTALIDKGCPFKMQNSTYGAYLTSISQSSWPLSWLGTCTSTDPSINYGYNYWVFKVNGSDSQVGASGYTLANGDVVSLVYTAGAKAKTHTISFNSNGGSSVAALTVLDSQSAAAPTAPTSSGSAFGGWYSDSELKNPVNWNAPVSADATYYAKWTLAGDPQVTIVIAGGLYDSKKVFTEETWLTTTQSGYGTGSDYAWPAIKAALDKNGFTYFAPEKTWGTYIEWISNGSGEKLAEQHPYGMYDCWNFYVNGALASNGVSSQKINPGDQITIAYLPMYYDLSDTVKVSFETYGGSIEYPEVIRTGIKATSPSTNPTRDGYTFGGWYTDSDCTAPVNWDKAISADTTYYAKWTHAKKTAWTELYGNTRFDTMQKVVEAGKFATGGTVVIATGDNFPDALAASALAGAEQAPIVLTAASGLSAQAKAVLTALAPSEVIVLGGPSAISDATYKSIASALPHASIRRISGENRTQTAIKIYQDGIAGGTVYSGDTCIIATGKDAGQGADALAISSYAYAFKTPVFLAEEDGTLSAETAQAINDAAFKHVIICGGSAAVNDSVKTQLAGLSATFTRLGGSTRYGTAESIVQWETGHAVTDTSNSSVGFVVEDAAGCTALTFGCTAVATGANFPDALASASLVGSKYGVLLLSDPSDSAGGACVALLATYGSQSTTGYFIGGPEALPASIKDYCKNATK